MESSEQGKTETIFAYSCIPPRFPPATWNVHERTLADEPRTNNLCEGWNSRFSSMVGFTHPSIWKAKSIQVETNEASTKILQSNIGNPPRKHTKRPSKLLTWNWTQLEICKYNHDLLL